MTIIAGTRPICSADTILTMVVGDGTTAASHARALARADASLRDLADAIHALCVIHGAFPGIVEHAGASNADPLAQAWLMSAAATMAGERALLVRLTSAAGPLPSTPGQAVSQAAILTQRHTLEMLARSDRAGCATGTALAFVLDWVAVRAVLDGCAARLSLPEAPPFGDAAAEASELLRTIVASPSVERAMAFGAQQMLAQHRGLWQLLESRAAARGAR